MKTTITELMLLLKQFEHVKIEWDDPTKRWEVDIYPDPINTLGYHCGSEGRDLRTTLMAALHQTEKWQLLNAYNLEVDRLQAVRQAETDAKALVIEARAEKKIEHFSVFYRLSEYVVPQVMWGD